MKKLLKLWQRIPVKIRACANLAGIILCVLVIYILIGSPPFSARHAFRRAEKADLVGPSRILAQIQPEGTPYDQLILSDAGDGVILFTYKRRDSAATSLLYAERTGDLTIAAAPDNTYYPSHQQASIPIVLFEKYPQAVRAELDLALSAVYKGTYLQNTYHLTADREYDGCFIFTLQSESPSVLGAEGQLFLTLQQVTGNSTADTRDLVSPATVRLYDSSGSLILEQTISLNSAAAKAHATQNTQ